MRFIKNLNLLYNLKKLSVTIFGLAMAFYEMKKKYMKLVQIGPLFCFIFMFVKDNNAPQIKTKAFTSIPEKHMNTHV